MKIRITKEVPVLKAWKKAPKGYAVIICRDGVKLECAETGKAIALVCVTGNIKQVTRSLEKIREVFDVDPRGMRPRLVVVSARAEESPAWLQFSSRAAAIVEV